MTPSRLNYLHTTSVLLGVHGGLMVGLGFIYCAFVPFGAASGEEPGFLVFAGCLGFTTPAIGALQLYAARSLRDRKHRRLAIFAAALGAYGSCIALCLPASALLAVGVAFVLIDPEVKRAFGEH